MEGDLEAGIRGLLGRDQRVWDSVDSHDCGRARELTVCITAFSCSVAVSVVKIWCLVEYFVIYEAGKIGSSSSTVTRRGPLSFGGADAYVTVSCQANPELLIHLISSSSLHFFGSLSLHFINALPHLYCQPHEDSLVFRQSSFHLYLCFCKIMFFDASASSHFRFYISSPCPRFLRSCLLAFHHF